MSVIIPTEDELRLRILAHIEARPDSKDTVSSVWQGYIAGLLEWGLLDINAYDRLVKLLPDMGRDQVVEILRGF